MGWVTGSAGPRVSTWAVIGDILSWICSSECRSLGLREEKRVFSRARWPVFALRWWRLLLMLFLFALPPKTPLGRRGTMRRMAETTTLSCPESRWRKISKSTSSSRRGSTTTTCMEPASSRWNTWLKGWDSAAQRVCRDAELTGSKLVDSTCAEAGVSVCRRANTAFWTCLGTPSNVYK